MTRRQILLLLLLAAGLVVAGFAALEYTLRPEPEPTLDDFRRLHVGMALNQVEAILGPPTETRADLYIWRIDRGQIHVWTEHNRVRSGSAFTDQGEHPAGPPPSLLDTIKTFLHL